MHIVLCLAALLGQLPDRMENIAAAVESDGVKVHAVRSPYQAGETQIRVLTPCSLPQSRRFPVVYILPVEAGLNDRYGDGMREVQLLALHERLQAIFVAPTFHHLPWYADHPTDPAIRQETYFLEVVVPFIERTYPVVAAPEGRLLLGFSKSGWGAWSLLLRHPDRFSKAVAWDAPLMMDQLGKYGTTPIFSTEETLTKYNVAHLLRAADDRLRGTPRLLLTGHGNFRQHHEQTHSLLIELMIPHEYRDGPSRSHDWHSGWVEDAAAWLLQSNPISGSNPAAD